MKRKNIYDKMVAGFSRCRYRQIIRWCRYEEGLVYWMHGSDGANRPRNDACLCC